MTDRDRLITKIMSLHKPTISLQTAMDIVDAIIDEGVIVPPVKVGQKIYAIEHDEESSWVEEFTVNYFYVGSKGIHRIYASCGTYGKNFRPKVIGKYAFLTKEEAEQALETDTNVGIKKERK